MKVLYLIKKYQLQQLKKRDLLLTVIDGEKKKKSD
jgi:hypothetical protein